MAEEISVQEEELCGCRVLSVELRSADAAEHLNRTVGTYITISPGTTLDGQAKIEMAGEWCCGPTMGGSSASAGWGTQISRLIPWGRK